MENRTKKIYERALLCVAKMQARCDDLAAEAIRHIPTDEFGNSEYDISCAYFLGDGLCFNDNDGTVVPVAAFFDAAEDSLVNYEQFQLLAI